MTDELSASLFENDSSFEEKALRVFRFQYENNNVYSLFCKTLDIHPDNIVRSNQIPLIPIDIFKERPVKTGVWEEELVFQSSGTSRMKHSHHYVRYAYLYKKSLIEGFRLFYGDPNQWLLLGYTPGYNDNPHSSLIWMLKTLIEASADGKSRILPLGIPLNQKTVEKLEGSGKRLMLFGAAFGLIDLAEQSLITLPEDAVVIETGGMKTYKKEIRRTELHHMLAENFSVSVNQVHSEYGMTELLSQAYDTGMGWFRTPPWMRVGIFKPDAPMLRCGVGEEGLIGVIDLANIYSCSFIMTGDVGVYNENGDFKVLGRWEKANLRGCNFLLEEEP